MVKTNIFNEAFTLLHEHGYDVHDGPPHNLTDFGHTDHDVLDILEENHHSYPSTHTHISDHSIDIHEDNTSPQKYNNYLDTSNQFNAWNYHPQHLIKKTDSGVVDTQKNAEQAKNVASQNPYTYFNPITGESGTKMTRQKRDIHMEDMHSHSESIHSENIHPESIHSTAVTFKDKRIAGVSKFIGIFFSHNILLIPKFGFISFFFIFFWYYISTVFNALLVC